MGNLSAFAFVCLCAGAALACGGGGGGGNEGGTSGGGTGGVGATGGTGATGGGTGATGGGTGATGGTGGSAPACDGPGYGTSDAPHLVNKFNAKVVDQDGNPAADMLAQVCGTDICINAKTDATGTVVTCVSGTGTCTAGIQPNKEITRPAFKYGDGTTFAKFAYLLPTTSSDYDIGTHMTIKLPAIGTGGDLTPGGTATSGSISLVLAADAVVEIDELVFDTPDLHKFRAIEVPIAKAPAAVDPALGFGMVVATTPIETHICPAAKLTVPNTPAWPAGTEVEIWYHGVDPGEAWAPYAYWAKMSGGKVSADGTTISTNDGEGVSELSIFGIRKK